MRSFHRGWTGLAPSLVLAWAGLARADVTVFLDLASFQTQTGATAQPELPPLGLVGRHVAQATVGDLTFAINNGSPDIALVFAEFTALHPGYEIGLSDYEVLDVISAFPVHALGSYFVEPTDALACNSLCPCIDATYLVTLYLGSTQVGQFTFNAPDDTLAFVGMWSDQPFEHVHYSDLSLGCDNEYWGRFFLGAPACPADFNGDGFPDIYDFTDFVTCFETGVCPPGRTADFNNDGFADISDFTDFVTAFETGC